MRTPHCNTPGPSKWNEAVDVRFSEIVEGMKLVAGGFECIPEDSVVEVHKDDAGFYVPCSGPDGEGAAGSEHHYLDGQVDDRFGTDIVVGLRRVL